MEVFLKNPLFVGVRIPEIGRIISLSHKLPNISPYAMSWLQVISEPFYRISRVLYTIQSKEELPDL